MTDPRAELADAVAIAELEAEISARRSDLAAGLVPADVRRALFRHELAARTNFAGLEDDVADNAAEILGRVAADRAQFIALLLTDLRRVASRRSPATPLERIGLRLLDIDGPLGLDHVTGVEALLDDAQRFHRGRLTVGIGRAVRRVIGEAGAQGISGPEQVAPKLDDVAQHQLDLLARRLAQAPHLEVVKALRDRVIEEPKDFVAPDELLERLDGHARQLAVRPLEDIADSAARQADVMGRAAGAELLPPAKQVYASELLDRNTCGPCSLVDGREYPSVADARLDYPHGTYHRCEGGLRCRGTLVFVWKTEADPTLDRSTVELPPKPDVARSAPGTVIGTPADRDHRDPNSVAHLDPRAVENANERAGGFWSYYFGFQKPISRAVLNVHAGQSALKGVDLTEAGLGLRHLDSQRAAAIPAVARVYNANDLRADIEAAARYLVNRVRRATPTTVSLWRGMTVRGDLATAAARFQPGQIWDTDVWSWTDNPAEVVGYMVPAAGARVAGSPMLVELLPGAQAPRISDSFPGRMAASREHLTVGRFEVVNVTVDRGVVRVVGRIVP